MSMNSLAEQAVEARSKILRRLKQDLFSVAHVLPQAALVCQSEICSCLDFNLP